MPWTYWHRLEFFRIDRGQRILVHTQEVDDHGFYLDKAGPEDYVRVCAEEVLRRWAPPGSRWRVVLWRLDATGRNKVRRLAEIELRWPATPTPCAPADVVGERP
ncbi:MAG TPA: hypothetical protein VIL00_16935 [Pseudonocardiaceae bacterium]